VVCVLLADFYAHGPGGPRHLRLSRLEIVGVEVRHLDLGDLGDLSVAQCTGHLSTSRTGPLGYPELLADEDRGGGVFSMNVKLRSEKMVTSRV